MQYIDTVSNPPDECRTVTGRIPERGSGKPQKLTRGNKKMPLTIKVYFANGDSLVTRFNGTMTQALDYYVGNVFNLGSITDIMTKCTKIEQL